MGDDLRPPRFNGYAYHNEGLADLAVMSLSPAVEKRMEWGEQLYALHL